MAAVAHQRQACPVPSLRRPRIVAPMSDTSYAYRAYDPCNSCATHTLPGQMPMKAVIRNPDGSVFKDISNY